MASGVPWCCDGCDNTLLSAGLGPLRVWVDDIIEESTAVGVSTSASGFDVTGGRVVEGVKVDEAIDGVSDTCDEVIRSAGLGKVLYVDPREVYP